MMIFQVNKNLFQTLTKQFRRNIHDVQPPAKILYPLESRRLLKVGGQDAKTFLQGLITNDMRHFDDGAKCMYAMFLNNKGRVLFDTLIHLWEPDDSFMLECDKNIVGLLEKHLKLYKLKRLVEIRDVNQDFKIHALISNGDTKIDKNNISIYKDPRLTDLGFRVISSASVHPLQVAEILGKDVKKENTEDGYKYLRYKLGVSEGADDLPPGSSFPLEANCDYLHGVSFHKGCYIGQEVTARVHHTGVVRKRIMPLKFNENVNEDIEKDAVISASDKPKSNLGKLKGFVQDYGIGLIRVKEALEAKALSVGNYSLEVVKPTWWPIEASKEKHVTKTE